jgi:ankyrin repeat protein
MHCPQRGTYHFIWLLVMDTKTVKLLVEEMLLGGGVAFPLTVEEHTPLHLAANHGHIETVRVLLELGDDVRARTIVLLESHR